MDLDKHQMTVAASLVTTARGVSVEQPKTSSGQRVVDLDSRTAEILLEHRKRQEEDARALRVPPSHIVFPRNGLVGRCHPNTLSNTLERLAKKQDARRLMFAAFVIFTPLYPSVRPECRRCLQALGAL